MNAVPSATSRSTLTRQWELLKLLPPKGPGITTLELQSRLSDAGHPTTKRTIERDLVELSRLFPLQCNLIAFLILLMSVNLFAIIRSFFERKYG